MIDRLVMAELKEKIHNFLDRKELELGDRYWLLKSAMEDVESDINDQFYGEEQDEIDIDDNLDAVQTDVLSDQEPSSDSQGIIDEPPIVIPQSPPILQQTPKISTPMISINK